MIALDHAFIADDMGRRMAAVVPIEEYQQLLQDHEELDEIRAYDAAKSQAIEILPFDSAMKEIGLA